MQIETAQGVVIPLRPDAVMRRAATFAEGAMLCRAGAELKVLFASCDAAPGFVALPCVDPDLEDTIARALGVTAQDMRGTQIMQDVAAMAAKLRDGGSVAFDDGWMVLMGGLAQVIDYLMERLADGAREAADAERRHREHLACAAVWEARYQHLALALRDALGPAATAAIAARAGN